MTDFIGRLPDGTTTQNEETYGNAWREFSDKMAEILDVEVIAMDPGILVCPKGYVGTTSASIPTWLCKKILLAAKNK